MALTRSGEPTRGEILRREPDHGHGDDGRPTGPPARVVPGTDARPAGEAADGTSGARWWRPRLDRIHGWQQHRVGLLLGTILAAAATVRLVNLDEVGFNSDEAVYAGQGASLAGNPAYVDYFPVFRAHPMLIQTMLSLIFREGEHDVAGRVLVAAFGVATVGLVYLLGRMLYTRNVGLLAAALLAVMPYHVVVTRQVLLDGPMVFFATLTLICVAKFALTERLVWMAAAGAAMGLTLLSKESSLVLVGAVYAFFALTPRIRRPVVGSLLAFSIAMSFFALYPLSSYLAGHTSTTKAYLVWQLVRRPNHSFTFYGEVVPWSVGLAVLAFAVLAVWQARKGPAWREVLLASWVLVPAIAFTVWPVKGFQYLLAAAPAIAVLAARGLLRVPWQRLAERLPRRLQAPRVLRGTVVAAVLASLLWVLAPQIGPNQGATGLAGSGGVAGGREAGMWVRENTPAGSVLLTLGPSMANLMQFYGQRRAYGLSVSPNPLKRNPSYVPIPNPDASLRSGDMQYVVWDAYSADRSVHFSQKLRQYARRYNGRVVHKEEAVRDGELKPVVVIYEVRP